MRDKSTLALINCTIDKEKNDKASAVYIKDGIIRLVSDDKSVLALCNPQTTVLDIKHERIMAGITDAHMHLLFKGREMYSRKNKLHYPYRVEEIKMWFDTVKDEILRYGITSVHTDDSDVFGKLSDAVDFYRKLSEDNNLPFRITYQARIRNELQLKEYIDEGLFSPVSDYFKVGAVLVKVDGDLSNRTAALTSDYSDLPGVNGDIFLDEKELQHLLELADIASCQVIFEAQGDFAVLQIVNAVKKHRQRTGSTTRHRIKKNKLISEELCRELAQNDIGYELTPGDVIRDSKMVIRKIGAERARYNNAWKTVLKSGVITGAGSDAPLNTLSPYSGMRFVTLRQDENNEPHFGWMPAERLTRSEAFNIYTEGNALLCGEEMTSGKIEKGMRGDIIAFIKDPYKVDDEGLLTLETGLTVVNGEIRYIK